MKYYWHIHHQELVEGAYEPIEQRIKYIKRLKPANEVDLRLKLLRPAINLPKAVREFLRNEGWSFPPFSPAVMDALIRRHKEQCEPDCPWVFRVRTYGSKYDQLEGTIFPSGWRPYNI